MMKLLDVLRERNISKLQLALNAGITPSDLYCALNGKKPFFPKYKRKIAEFLQIDEAELFAEGEGENV